MIAEPWVSIDCVTTHQRVAKDSVNRLVERNVMVVQKKARMWKFSASEFREWVRHRGTAWYLRDDEKAGG